MTAVSPREELEALLWRRITPRTPGEAGRQEARKLVEDILAAADTYAAARIVALTPHQLRGRLRLAETTDAIYPGGRTTL
jgi:hypothetical protein